ncbi:hypothetical protein [uncultured Nocardioides sp.]|uniref:hypothetical protein n=1 Tax=uncultured Nocardioides sp. TaxID=198441 RepID=UPI00261CDC41|nr:hypothetical protein [uncultured Nocardioides sp.]
MKRVVLAIVVVATSLLPGLTVSPAQALACSGSTGNTSEYARTIDGNGQCGTVKARHKYDPPWSANDYWTAYDVDADVAQSARNSVAYLWDNLFNQ